MADNTPSSNGPLADNTPSSNKPLTAAFKDFKSKLSTFKTNLETQLEILKILQNPNTYGNIFSSTDKNIKLSETTITYSTKSNNNAKTTSNDSGSKPNNETTSKSETLLNLLNGINTFINTSKDNLNLTISDRYQLTENTVYNKKEYEDYIKDLNNAMVGLQNAVFTAIQGKIPEKSKESKEFEINKNQTISVTTATGPTKGRGKKKTTPTKNVVIDSGKGSIKVKKDDEEKITVNTVNVNKIVKFVEQQNKVFKQITGYILSRAAEVNTSDADQIINANNISCRSVTIPAQEDKKGNIIKQAETVDTICFMIDNKAVTFKNTLRIGQYYNGKSFEDIPQGWPKYLAYHKVDGGVVAMTRYGEIVFPSLNKDITFDKKNFKKDIDINSFSFESARAKVYEEQFWKKRSNDNAYITLNSNPGTDSVNPENEGTFKNNNDFKFPPSVANYVGYITQKGTVTDKDNRQISTCEILNTAVLAQARQDIFSYVSDMKKNLNRYDSTLFGYITEDLAAKRCSDRVFAGINEAYTEKANAAVTALKNEELAKYKDVDSLSGEIQESLETDLAGTMNLIQTMITNFFESESVRAFSSLTATAYDRAKNMDNSVAAEQINRGNAAKNFNTEAEKVNDKIETIQTTTNNFDTNVLKEFTKSINASEKDSNDFSNIMDQWQTEASKLDPNKSDTYISCMREVYSKFNANNSNKNKNEIDYDKIKSMFIEYVNNCLKITDDKKIKDLGNAIKAWVAQPFQDETTKSQYSNLLDKIEKHAFNDKEEQVERQ